MYSTGKLYKLDYYGRDYVGDNIPIWLKSATAPNVIIYGSELKPDNVSDMQDIASEVSPFIISDWYDFTTLPAYIAFIGTCDSIEVSNVNLTYIKDIT